MELYSSILDAFDEYALKSLTFYSVKYHGSLKA